MEFHYQAANGQGQVLSGQLSAADAREALRALQQQNLTPIQLEAVGLSASYPLAPVKKASAQEKTLVLQELTTLLNAGVPLAEAVSSISAAHAASSTGAAFSKVLSALQAGQRFSDALSTTDLDLPTYVYQLVAAGELTGKLGDAMQTAVAQMEYQDRTRQEMRNALTYPAILVIAGIAAILLVFIVVVPKFANLLKGNTANVPLLSQWVIGTGMFVKTHLIWVGMAVTALAFTTASVLKNPQMRARCYESLVRIPVLGAWILETEMGRWASMLAALLSAKVPLVTAMDLALSSVRISYLRNSLQQVLREVRGGSRIADALAANRALQPTGINLVRVGERSGELAPMLGALAKLYENSSKDRMKRFLLLLEPIAILLIGTVIGIIMVAIMLAVTSMNDKIS